VTEAQGPSGARRILGVAVMLLGAALMGWGAHYLIKSGNCSSTGYVSYGPVPKCGGGEALYILSVFFVGPVLAVVGWGISQVWRLLAPLVCASLGAGLISLRFDPSAASGAKSFGLIVGICFVALALVAVFFSVRKRLRPKTAQVSMTGPDTSPAVPVSAPVMTTPPSDQPTPGQAQAAGGSGSDPLDKIAKLAQLRDSGALTEEEFGREKAKLLAQM